MILHSFQSRFKHLKSINNHIQCALDIGAHHGDFTETINSVWPTCIVYQIEADVRQRSFLKSNAIIALLGNVEQSSVNFYTLDQDKITTGSSIFLENTTYYNNKTTVVVPIPMTTLDKLMQSHNFAGDWCKYGLIKIDTQGSELLILEGAKKFLELKTPRYILLECSLIEYNFNAPKIYQVMSYMNQINYDVKDIFDLSYSESGLLMQTDILFERKQ